jgi:Multimeric flavodoxin WrbA
LKTVILDGSSHDSPLATVNQEIASIIDDRGWLVEQYHLYNENIATCTGCFGCWLKTPGECVVNDKGREIAKKVIQSDLVVILTPITFGGYSYHVKKMLDRFIPNILPFFTQVDGEIHHQPRYEKNPSLLAIGYLKENNTESGDIFKKLVERNAINFYSPIHRAEILKDAKLDFDISSFLKDVEVKV